MTKPSMIPALPDSLPALQGPEGALARAGPAGSGLFSLTGRRACAWGVETRGLEEVTAGGWTLLSSFASELGPASGIVVGPSSVRREVLTSGASLLETVLVPLDGAGAAVQWTRPRGSRAEVALRIEWSMGWSAVKGHSDGQPAAGAARGYLHEQRASGSAEGHSHEQLENGVRVSASGLGGREPPTAFALLHPRPSRLEVRPESAGVRISAEVVSSAEAPVTLLLVGAESAEEAGRALRSLSALRAQERRAEQAAMEARDERLASHGAGPIDDALEWAKARTRGAIASTGSGRTLRRGGAGCEVIDRTSAQKDRGSPFVPSTDAAWLALGALAAGDPEPAEILIEGEQLSAYELLVAARYAAWSGRVAALLRHRAAAEALGQRLSESSRSDPVLRAAARELADAWDSNDRTLAARLRSAASAGRGRGDARRLPMAGRADADSEPAEHALLNALFDETPAWYRAPTAQGSSSVERALRAWALCRAGDPEQGQRELLAHASVGSPRGLWPERSGDPLGCADHTASAALLPAALLFGVLGASADAPVGRLRLSPRLPSAWSEIGVSGIHVGEARVRLDYRRSGSEHRFTAAQETGRIPLMLILEPDVPENHLVEVQVDGSAAELDRSSRAGRSCARVQLPLDAPRVVTLVGGGADL